MAIQASWKASFATSVPELGLPARQLSWRNARYSGNVRHSGHAIDPSHTSQTSNPCHAGHTSRSFLSCWWSELING
jgi:hypothetical protein